MGNSHSHEAPLSNVVESMEVDDAPPPPPLAPSLPQAVPSSSSASTTPNRRRSRAPSSPRLSSPPLFSTSPSSSRFPAFIRSPRTNRDGTTTTASTTDASTSTGSGGGDRPPKDKKRRRISEMLGMSKSPSFSRGEGLGGASSSSRGGGGGPNEVRMEEEQSPAPLLSSAPEPPISTPLQAPLPRILTPDEFPLPPSRPSSTPPTTDDLPPSPPSPPPEDHDDPLWSPRLRAQSLISQLSQEIAQGETSPPVAAYIDSVDPSSSHPSEPAPESDLDMGSPSLAPTTVRSSASSIGSGRSAESGGGGTGSGERQSLRERLMSGLLGRGSSGENGSSLSTRSRSSTASTSETVAPSSPSASPISPPTQHQAHERGNVPTGTSLIVQGLVQTSAPPRPQSQTSPSSSGPSSPSSTETNPSGRATRPLPDRRRSRSAPSPPGSFTPSFDEQAILLGGLLSVATAATASSLLSPPPPPNTANASGAAAPRLATSTIDSIRQRIARVRSRSPATAPSTTAPAGIEQILRDYMSTNINPTGSGSAGGGSTSTTATIPVGAGAEAAAASTEPVVPPELGSFEAFLADLQVDLVRALREYNGFPPAGQEGPARAAPTEEAGSSEGSTEEGAVPEASEPGEGGGAAGEGATGEEEQARAAAVGGGGTGLGVEPRRLNWMRVYRFPPRNVQGTLAADRAPSNDSVDDAASIPSDGASTSESTLSADPANASEQAPAPPAPTRLRDTSVTPMIMVGVRSISRADVAEAFGGARPANPPPPTATRRASSSSLPSSSSSTDPSSPASNLNTLPGSSTSLDQDGDAVMDEALPTSSTTGGPPPSASNLGRLRQAMRGIRDRRRGENGTEEEAAAQPTGERAGTRSFVLWVVGGLYSSDHPLLTAPGLFGGTLDHDDLWALAELLGQVKPPTASSEAIANSGLEIIKGAMVKGWCEEKKVLENSADRCMVCLGDYEEEEDCRILECKHVFHQECIDKWLHVGRNACPACRSPGVKAAEPAQAPTPTPTPATPPISTTSATTAASTDEASSSSTPVV